MSHNTGLISVEQRASGVVVLSLGNAEENVVTLTEKRLFAFRAALAQVKDMRPRGLIIIGPGPDMFSVGADISVIQSVTDPLFGEQLAQSGQEIFDELSALPFPTIAAISGPCVGGACELSLACSFRICSDRPSTIIGLPETKLGILPGFGGTQRLPKVVGVRKALDIILAGKTLRPKQALDCGLVVDVVSFDRLRERAEAVLLKASTIVDRPIPLIDRLIAKYSFGRSYIRKQATKQLQRQTKGFYPAPPTALDCVLYGLEHGLTNGLKYEAQQLGRLIVTPECKALTRIFFLTEASKSLGKAAAKAVREIHGVVIGAGTMGAGIASLFAQKKIRVVVRDTDAAALLRAKASIEKNIDRLTYLREDEQKALKACATTSLDDQVPPETNFVVEAVFENMDVKKKLFSDIKNKVSDDCVLATNTSSLSVTEMATSIGSSERFVGMHFFNPVEKMPLVEIIRGKETSERTLVWTAALTNRLGKFPIVVEDVPGFLVNRVLTPYLNAAALLFSKGYPIQDIDKAALRFGMPMGPFRLLDEVGLDVAAHVGEIMANGYGERMKGLDYAKQLVDAGRKGKKNGHGFYDFNKSGEAKVSTKINKILNLGEMQPVTDKDTETITDALILSLLNEAVRCLDEGVAGSAGSEAASQIDLATVMGIGFPPFRGGILYYGDSIGASEVKQRLQKLEERFGSTFSPWQGIVSRAQQDKKFLANK